MQYYVIQNRSTKKNAAVVFHDYLTKHYIVQSVSEAFRRSFEASLKSLGRVMYTAVDNKLLKSSLSLDNPSWAREILKKACGSSWTFTRKGELSHDLQVNDIISRYLK